MTILSGMKKLKQLDLATKILKDDFVTNGKGRKSFDAILAKHLEMKERISASAKIVESQTYESAIAKIQTRTEKEVTTSEGSAMRSLNQEKSAESRVAKRSKKITSFAQLVFMKMRKNDEKVSSSYLDLRFIVSNPNNCEKFFS